MKGNPISVAVFLWSVVCWKVSGDACRRAAVVTLEMVPYQHLDAGSVGHLLKECFLHHDDKHQMLNVC